MSASNPAEKDNVYKNSLITWDNSIALLFGIAGMGFRLDIIQASDLGFGGTDTNKTYDGNYMISASKTNGPKMALSWGSHFGNLYPWAKVGVKFSDITSAGGVDLDDPGLGDDYGKKATSSSNGFLNIEAASLYDFSGGNFTDTVTGILTSGLQFKDVFKGDSEVMGPLGASSLAGG